MARKAKYDWGKSRDGRYQKFETRISTKLIATASGEPYADSGYIDIAQCLSMINRKLVRQGQVFKVKNFNIYSKDESPVTTFKIGVLPRTWMMFNSYRKARALWLQQAQRAYADLGEGNLPKYLDFKVLADVKHYTNKAAGSDLLLPMDFDENLATMTDVDWDYSKLHTADSTSDAMYIHMVGPHYTEGGSEDDDLEQSATLASAGAILAYQQSRGQPFEDIDATGSKQQTAYALNRGPFGSLTAVDDQQTDIVTTHSADNDSPPYDVNEFAGGGGELRELITIGTGRIPQKTVGGPVSRLPTFEAPLGLIRVEVDAGSAMSSEEVELHFDTEIIGTI